MLLLDVSLEISCSSNILCLFDISKLFPEKGQPFRKMTHDNSDNSYSLIPSNVTSSESSSNATFVQRRRGLGILLFYSARFSETPRSYPEKLVIPAPSHRRRPRALFSEGSFPQSCVRHRNKQKKVASFSISSYNLAVARLHGVEGK